MDNTNLAKGNKLEEAVSLIERAILESNPSIRASNLKITPKKIIINEGVRYEIDLFVEIDQGFGYNGTFIFECKNWEAAVSTDEIIKFSEKIKVTNAQKGFFIAKGYTSSAKSRAEQDERIDLLYMNDNPLELAPFMNFRFQFINKVNKINAIEVFESGITDIGKAQMYTIDFENCLAQYRGQEGKFKDFAILLMEEMARDKMKEIDDLPEGKYARDAEKEFTFQREELRLKQDSFDKSIDKIKIKVTFDMELIRPKIVSKIDVLTRGRFIEYEAVRTSTGDELKFAFVAIPLHTKP